MDSSVIITNTATDVIDAQVETVVEEKEEDKVKAKESSEKQKTDETKPKASTDDGIKLDCLDKELAYEMMSMPTYSGHESRFVTYLVLWARKHGISYQFDDYGNLYFKKGEVKEGEFYPCVTSHLDTVQDRQGTYALAGQPLEIKTRVSKGKHEMYLDDCGIGADCKTGVLICLTIFDHVDVLKGCFFLQEETGMQGSRELDVNWFNDVGYVIGFDSPDFNRAAYACSGTLLFDTEFFENNIRDLCKSFGVDDFRSEPFTDVVQIRDKTDIVCMNFGNGGYLAHSKSEYMVIEETNEVCKMGIALVKHLGFKQFKLSSKAIGAYTQSSYYSKWHNPSYVTPSSKYSLNSVYGYYGGGTSYDEDGMFYEEYYSPTKKNKEESKSAFANAKVIGTDKKDNTNFVSFDVFEYALEKYKKHCDGLKDGVEKRCKELGVDFKKFEDLFDIDIKF